MLAASSCTLRPNRLERRFDRSYDPQEGDYPRLRDNVFSRRARFTGILRTDRFNRIMGFWIFLRGPHRSELTPVVLVHGYTAGPRMFRPIADSIDTSRFEPWFCYYATGVELEHSANLLRQSLAEMVRRYDEPSVAIVAYSLGGLVVRQALRPTDDGISLPRVPLFVSVATPWDGSEDRRLDSDRNINPAVHGDVSRGSPFLQQLFDDPLPPETDFHILYSLTERDRRRIPGEDDGLLSKDSMARSEAISEASSATVIPEADHVDIIEDPTTVALVNRLLGELESHNRIIPPQLTQDHHSLTFAKSTP